MSFLISLQRDQVTALHEQGIAEAAQTNSTVKASQRRETFEDLRNGGFVPDS